MSADSVTLEIKWGKETLEYSGAPAAGVKHWKQEIQDLTGVPAERVKLMAKTKGLWKGVLKDDFDLGSVDWKSLKPPIQVLLMGSATQVAAPTNKTVFLEDLPPEQAAAVEDPSGLVNLGNTCYLNSVVQCLRAVSPLRRSLQQFQVNSSLGSNPGQAQSALMVTSLRETLQKLDSQATAVHPASLLQATRVVFPQFAQRGPHGQPMQQDAEEFFSGVLTTASSVLNKPEIIKAGFENGVTESELSGADNLIDALFGLKMKETLTCDELPSSDAEPPVISYDLHRKLVCNIQGGSDMQSNLNVSHIAEGIQLALEGKIEKHSDVLGRNAMWTRRQRIARLPRVIAVQFGRFYWKATPDSQDHAGVKCKIMKPVAFSSTLDVYEFCTEEIQKVLKVSRDKALAEEEDRINRKLKGQLENGNVDAMEVEDKAKEEEEVEMDDELKSALAMSMEESLAPVGPGLPENFQGIYELFAVVTHKGRDADGGHYMAWVKADNNSSGGKVEKIADTDVDNEDWYVYDDDEVSPCKTEDVLKLKGGGDWHMSYLNFYRAKK
ncbi:ubiquitin carboxyl-terminal hydrolase 14 [Fistulifera solaris]|uniref:Ubiquitin carboxyl-terminal hydrolase n=1 Tax=Fistulifera solaris TaxID=1519565 RepID=A0A1Z5JNS6_FISSO|nr:ubiquitin carboxyl-terminal hydrolase 14 [Fistulifera solaris]|eukprot:GAX15667.1 ubiquitin carboxyl-terminal hydrolase 14 [Fistulifera solaris]